MIFEKDGGQMTRWNKKKVTKNINIELSQEAYLKNKFGKDVNFSDLIRKILKLGITLLELSIINDFEESSISGLFSDLSEETIRTVVRKDKVLEYKEFFELLTQKSLYLIPKIESFPSVLMNIGDIFSNIGFTKIDKKTKLRLSKIVKGNNIIDEVNVTSEYFEFSGSYPYSLIWYAKIVVVMLTRSKHKWEIRKMIPEELTNVSDLRKIRIYMKKGTSREASLKTVDKFFNSLSIKLKDQNNEGIWTLLNNDLSFILDESALRHLKGNPGTSIPFLNHIKEINSLKIQKREKALLLFNFYNKIHLVTSLFCSDGVFTLTIREEGVKSMLLNTLAHLKIKYELETQGTNLIFSIS